MKKSTNAILLLAALAILSGSPLLALAHGHTSFEINERVYSFTVGSLNEPVAVDDKTGVELHIESMSHSAHEMAEMSGIEHVGTPVTGLEKTLKVELLAGNSSRVIDLSPAYGEPGSYTAPFTPTVQTTYSYRVFGTIDSVPFDYTWACNPAGHTQTEEDEKEVEVSPRVTRIELAGAFSCPVAKADLGFPEPSLTSTETREEIDALKAKNRSSKVLAVVGIALGALGLAAGTQALRRKKA